jgi:hypothetical protein
MAKHLLGWSLAFLDRCHNKTTCLFCLLSLLSWRKVHNSFLPSNRVPELGAVWHSKLSSTSVELGFPLFSGHFVSKVSCQSFSHFLMELQWRKRSFADCRFILHNFFSLYIRYFQQLFLQKIGTKIRHKIRLEKQAFVSSWFIWGTKWYLID